MQFKVTSVDSFVIEFSTNISLEVSQKIKFYFEAVQEMQGIIEVIPSYTTLFVQYDIFQIEYASLIEKIQSITYKKQSQSSRKLITVPVYYGLEVGWDLERISSHNNIAIEDIIKQHTKDIYTVYAIGFAPGFAYLGEVNQRIAMSRLQSPRKMVPKGSVAIADTQTAIYPNSSPGGWNVIGRTAFEMFDKGLPKLCPVSMGDQIQFQSISKEEFLSLGGKL